MKKFDINRFYIGELNIGFGINSLIGKERHTREQINKLNLYGEIILNGALDITRCNYQLIDYLEKREYKKVLSLFYHLDDGKYFCLHNKKIYGRNTADYCDNLIALKNALPKLGFYIGNEITFNYALCLFNKLVNHKLHYNNTKYDLNKFYNGRIELAVDRIGYKNYYPYDKEYQPRNILESLLLENNFISGSYVEIDKDDNYEYHIDIYKSVFYLFGDGGLYSLNTNKVYRDSEKNCGDHKIHILNSLKDEFLKQGILYKKDNISIPKVLKLQNKMK